MMDITVANTDSPFLLVLAIEELEQRAHRLGQHVTAHALNRAKNALGWEMAGHPDLANDAALDRRPGK